ncbi:MAG: NapC/NirT family cytochrome c [Planctomycetota bacterium]
MRAEMQRFLLILRSNWISWSGALLTTVTFMAFLSSWLYLSVHGSAHGAYVGMFVFVVLPILFVTGLLMIPIGVAIYRRQLAERMRAAQEHPIKLLRLLALLTVINFAVVGTGGYEALHYMDSQQFCGTLCHEVMSPTYQAYVDSPHARVACVECHIGSGASWFVKSKISGARQVLAVLFDTYQRPIPTPVHDLRPARETCEQCHWPDKFTGDRLVVRKHYDNDRDVTESTTALVLKTGGIRPDGSATGIHWHVHPGNRVTYVATDDKRRVIPWVKFTNEKGEERIYTVDGVDPANPPEGEVRTMDCIDCHNQPSHQFENPETAIDRAIAAGLVSRKLPFIRKVGLEALRMAWTRENVVEGIRRHLSSFYASDGGLAEEQKGLLDSTSRELANIWLRNVHPAMGITWGTYPRFQGHVSMDGKPTGCARCHDGEHLDADGDEISMDCTTCHTMLADRVKDPEILKQLGLDER